MLFKVFPLKDSQPNKEISPTNKDQIESTVSDCLKGVAPPFFLIFTLFGRARSFLWNVGSAIFVAAGRLLVAADGS